MDMLFSYFKILLLLSIPQAYAHIRITFAIWGLKPQLHGRKLLVFSIVNSLLIDLDILHVPTEIHMVSSFLLTFIVVFFLFRSFGIKKMLIVYFSYFVLIMFTEMMGALLLELAYGLEPQKEMFKNHMPELISVIVPVFIVLYLLSHFIEQKNFKFFRQLYSYLLNLNQTRMKEILLLTFFQAFLLGILFVLGTENKHNYTESTFNVVIYSLVLITFGAFFYTLRLLVCTRIEAVRQTQDVYVEEIGKMFTSIRGQRHDFLNHVQVMCSMLKMNKLEQLNSYMEDIVKEAHTVSNIISHSSPAVAAFIQAKTEMAFARNIPFTYELPSDLDIESTIKSIDLVKIMGNLIDNAFEESDTLPSEQRIVQLIIRVMDGKLKIEVRNQGRHLSEKDKQMIILPGYTTKKAGHSGLGLAIVHERVRHYKGLLNILSSAESGTAIQVILPHHGDK